MQVTSCMLSHQLVGVLFDRAQACIYVLMYRRKYVLKACVAKIQVTGLSFHTLQQQVGHPLIYTVHSIYFVNSKFKNIHTLGLRNCIFILPFLCYISMPLSTP
jgi:hypothetical protein